MRFYHCLLILLACGSMHSHGQVPTALNAELSQLAQSYRNDERGPYQGIRWFCPGGEILSPQQRCAEVGGVQHGLLKERLLRLQQEQQIYWGQVLAGTDFQQFWDAQQRQSRLKQYQLERFLQRADDGWIMHKARLYRGAVQAEDEDRWGLEFFRKILADDSLLQAHFFLLRQAVKDIPHLGAKGNRWENIRAVSKTLAEQLRAFEPLRVKLHGQPNANDLQKVREFRRLHQDRINPEQAALFDTLEADLDAAFRTATVASLQRYLPLIPKDVPLADPLQQMIAAGQRPVDQESIALVDLMWLIREHILTNPKGANRLTFLDLSNDLESLVFARASNWQPQTAAQMLSKNYTLAKASAAAGFLESWEWQEVEPQLRPPTELSELAIADFALRAEMARRVVEWGAGMVRADYNPTVTLFAGFEPLALEFMDDRIRSSVLLPLGETASALSELAAEGLGIRNQVLTIKEQTQLRGLNPGYAFGELVVIAGTPENLEYSPQKIYVIEHPPADLTPVAGILTVSAGNMVSHVQLLARNLGIPNATLSVQNLNELMAFNGKQVFYAVSPRGAVVMTLAGDLSTEQAALVVQKERPESKIRVPVDRIDFDADVMPMSGLRTVDSGRICGPKAANLGQLKSLFPKRVGEGLVIPFGVFRRNLDQQMPGHEGSYWQHLQGIFASAKAKRGGGADEAEVEREVVAALGEFRTAISTMSFLPEFEARLDEEFKRALGAPLGTVPVFIRSDTNMEDLKDFTGAGLNLTVFNVSGRDKILQSIRDVWASPYTERSYGWRQRYLLNPENVYPSVLLLPTVDVQSSGVMITAGVSTGSRQDVTVAFSRGAGGAVEGQAAETFLLLADGRSRLLAPSRETKFTRLPTSGGTVAEFTRFQSRLLSSDDLQQLRTVAADVRQRLPGTPGMTTQGPFDVELGFFDGQIKLFQVRPYVENKKAKSSLYLRSLDSVAPVNAVVKLNQTL